MARNWLAISLSEQGRYGEQLEQIEAGLAIDPLNPTLLENSGALLHEQGRYEDAVRAYERLLALPERPATFWVLRNVHRDYGNLTEALRWALRMQKAALAGSARALVPALGVLARLDQLGADDPRFAALRSVDLNPAWLLEIEAALRRLGYPQAVAALAQPYAPKAGAGPSLWYGQMMGRVALLSGDVAGGITQLAPYFPPKVAAHGPGSGGLQDDTWLLYVWALKQRGDEGQAREALRAFERAVYPNGVPAAGPPDTYYLAALAAALSGDANAAFGHLDTALARGWNDSPLARHDPRWGQWRSDARFAKVLERADAAIARHRAAIAAQVAAAEPDFLALKR